MMFSFSIRGPFFRFQPFVFGGSIWKEKWDWNTFEGYIPTFGKGKSSTQQRLARGCWLVSRGGTSIRLLCLEPSLKFQEFASMHSRCFSLTPRRVWWVFYRLFNRLLPKICTPFGKTRMTSHHSSKQGVQNSTSAGDVFGMVKT